MGECGEEQIWILFKCVKFLKSLSCFEIDIESNESPVKSICSFCLTELNRLGQLVFYLLVHVLLILILSHYIFGSRAWFINNIYPI